MLRGHLGEEPTPPSVLAPDTPADLEDCLLRCLAKDPAGRPATASALRAARCACDGDAPWTPGDAERWWAMHEAALTGSRGTGDGV